MWKYSLTVDAKGEDRTLAQSGRKVRAYPGVQRYRWDKFWLALPPDQAVAARTSFATMRSVFQHKGWTLYLDELRLFSDPDYLPKYAPELPAELERLWLYGRSRGITVVTGTQAPRWCPAAAFEQPTHFLIGRTQSRSNLKMMEKISADTDRIKDIVPYLDRFEFLYVQSGSDDMAISKFPLKGSGR